MVRKKDNKAITLNEVARMVVNGFDHVNTEIIKFKNEVNARLDKVEQRLDKVEQGLTDVHVRLDKVEYKMEALTSNVGNYLELSERRYFELKHRDVVLAKWVKRIGDKIGVPIEVSQLEKI